MIKKKLKSSPELKKAMREVSPASYIDHFAPDMERSMQLPQRFSSGFFNKMFNSKKKLVFILAVLFVVGAVIFGAKSYYDLRKTQQELAAVKNDPNSKNKEEAEKIVQQVAKLVILPEGEDPTVATVTDPAKLNDQPFFANSVAGDKVLIYQEARRAILYRPSENKVIEIAPLNTDGVSSGGIAGEDITNPKSDSSNTKDTNTTNKNSNSVNSNSSNTQKE